MNPQISAALIAGGVSLISLAGTVVVAIAGFRATRSVGENTLAEQRTRTLNERFAAAAAQLGDAQPAVRLAGVYAMAGLADDWQQNRQTCVDVLCAYLRLPYDPHPGDDAEPDKLSPYRANREVRHTIIRLIGVHLRPGAPGSWQGLNLNFTGVIFDGGDFSYAEFSGGEVYFDGAKFSRGKVYFPGAKFSRGTVYFGDAEFSSGEVYFTGAEFSGGRADFGGAEFSGGRVDFGGARFSGGTADFGGARFSGGRVNFGGARFSGGTADFGRAEFSGGRVSFGGAEFSGGRVDFGGARFSGGTVDFDGAKFSRGSKVDFGRAEFSRGSSVDFGGAEFSGGTVDFTTRVTFSGGAVNFSQARDWSHLPDFEPGFDEASPPPGVTLPTAAGPPPDTPVPTTDPTG